MTQPYPPPLQPPPPPPQQQQQPSSLLSSSLLSSYLWPCLRVYHHIPHSPKNPTPTSTMTSRTSWAMLTAFMLILFSGIHIGNAQGVATDVSVFESAYKVAEFKSPAKNISFRHMVVNIQTQDVYVGGVNHLYQLDSNLKPKVDVQTGPKNYSIVCPSHSSSCTSPRKMTNDYNKVLVIDYPNNTLITCGTLYRGSCVKRDLSDISKLFDPSIADGQFEAVITTEPNTSVIAFVAPGPKSTEDGIQHDVLYLSNSWTDKTKIGMFLTANSLAMRNLNNFKYTTNTFYMESYFRVRNTANYPATFKYGFSSENFSYMLNVQMLHTDVFMSKILRVCQNDPRFRSYTELPLNCVHRGTQYNILQAAYVTKAGRELAQSLGIDTKKDVLYGLFSHSSPAVPKDHSDRVALCVYPMNIVRKKFTENIRRCFNGTGSWGGYHLGAVSKCTSQLLSFEINDTFCGDESLTMPRSGELPVETEATITFPLPSVGSVTSLRVASASDYTVAFVGTQTGHVLKVALESNDTAHVYETVNTGLGAAIRSDMPFDDDQHHLYLMASSKIVKMRVNECSQYTTCTDCLAAGDPYCGWCLLEDKCSRRETCQGMNLPKRWLPYNSQECPHIKQVVPDLIQASKKRLLTLDVQNLPEFGSDYSYQCLFSSLEDSENPVKPVKTDAQRSNTQFQCDTPRVEQLPAFGDGHDSAQMKLSVLMNSQAVADNLVTFFDCNVHSSCTPCSKSKFPCSWCIKKHLCTDLTERHCVNDELITGSNNASLDNNLHDDCPQIKSVDQKREILVPAGSEISVEIKAVSLRDFQMNNLKCHFIMDRVIVTSAKAEAMQGGSTYKIICDKVDFTYMRQAGHWDVPLKVLWGGGDYPLDNPGQLKVVMYKCSSLANTCGDCLMTEAKYQCGWCKKSREHCTTDMFCQGPSSRFLKRGGTCLDPQIISFHPKAGPVAGGTLITIQGKNLGFNETDVFVTVGLKGCKMVDYDAPNKITCRTQEHPPSFVDKAIPVRVGIGIGSNQQHTEASSFTFVQPRITNIHPMIGPFDGGTVITLTGQHLDTGSNLSVEIGTDNECLDAKSHNSTSITCRTAPMTYSTSRSPARPLSLVSYGKGAAVAVASTNTHSSSSMDVKTIIDNAVLQPIGVVFKYVANPNITWMSRFSVLRSGGQLVNVSGQNLHHVQSPMMVVWHDGRSYTGPCTFSVKPKTNMTCLSPSVESLSSLTSPVQLEYGFFMDGVQALRTIGYLQSLEVYPDPILDKYEDNIKHHPRNHDMLYIQGRLLDPVSKSDVKIFIGDADCPVKSVANTMISCSPPMTQPSATTGSGPPEVVVNIGHNLTYKLGVLKYEEEEGLSKTIIIIIAAVSAVLIILILPTILVCYCKFRRNDDKVKELRKDMDQLESRVANECKEAFAELQTDMTELTSETDGSVSIPFWDYRTYCMRVLFPGCHDHPVIRELELDYNHREDTVLGLKLFFNLIRNKTFLLLFIRTLETRKDFTIKERVNVASLISVALQTQMEYNTEILKILLAELIEKTVLGPKSHPQLLLRRNESVAEKMLTNWFTFLLYRFLKDCAGEPLFMLYGAIKQQVSKGPVDAITSEARYSLSEDKLIRQQVHFNSMVVHVMDIDADRCYQPSHPVKVLDCDTISQVKEKILDANFKSAPFNSRPRKEDLDLVYFDHNPPEWTVTDKSQIPLKMFPKKDTRSLVLSDEDHTTKMEGTSKRLNTLSHYKVPDGAFVALHPKQTSMYNMSFMSDKSSKFSEHTYYNQSPSLTRNMNTQNIHIDVEGCKAYHLVRHQDAEYNVKEGDRGNKMVSEIYLPRLLVTKCTLQSFVDDLFERIFSTAHGSTALPLAIKYMFDFLDDQALHHGVTEEAVHIWKSNSLPLRFWVNVIKNPDFAFDIYKSNIVDSCLTVIGQTFMDCCSNQEHKLTKDSPSCKLLFAKDIPKYKLWVARYYQDIKIMPAISDQDMTAMLTEESRTHQNEFNTNAALLELYKYVKKYFEDIYTALEEDEFAKKSKLTSKLEQVASAMDGTNIC